MMRRTTMPLARPGRIMIWNKVSGSSKKKKKKEKRKRNISTRHHRRAASNAGNLGVVWGGCENGPHHGFTSYTLRYRDHRRIFDETKSCKASLSSVLHKSTLVLIIDSLNSHTDFSRRFHLVLNATHIPRYATVPSTPRLSLSSPTQGSRRLSPYESRRTRALH